MACQRGEGDEDGRHVARRIGVHHGGKDGKEEEGGEERRGGDDLAVHHVGAEVRGSNLLQKGRAGDMGGKN